MRRPLKWLTLCVCMIGMLACGSRASITLPGYVEGRYTYISTLSTGMLASLDVKSGMMVKAKQLLFTLNPSPQSEGVTIANAKVQEALNQKDKAIAHFQLQQTNHERNKSLWKKDIISKEAFDDSTNSYQQALAEKNAALARFNSLQANEKRAVWEMQQKTITAPVNALVFDTYYTVGENVQAGKPVLALLAPDKIKVIFFVPEPLLNHLKPGTAVSVTCDNCKTPVTANITYISTQAEYTPPIIYSNEERQKLVFRVEAYPEQDINTLKLHPGQPVSITLSTR